MARSLNSTYYPRQQAAAERSMSWMVTKLDSDVASRPTRSRRAERLSVARPQQSVGAGSGLDTNRSAHGAHLFPGYALVDHSSCSSNSSSSSSQSHFSQYKIPRQVDPSALGTSLRRQTRGSQHGLGRLDTTRSAALQRVSSGRETTTPVGLGVCSNLCTHNKSDFISA